MSSDRIPGISGVDLQGAGAAWDWATARSMNEISSQVRRANKALEALDIRAKFSVHQGTGQIMVKLENCETGEVVREIPPEKLLDLVAKMREIASSVVDGKA